MAKKKSKKVQKSILFTAALAIVVISVFSYLIINEGNILPKTDKEEIAAVVNGEEITQEELDLAYSSLPQPYASLISKEDLLEQLIDKKLLLQEAKETGITVSEEELAKQMEAKNWRTLAELHGRPKLAEEVAKKIEKKDKQWAKEIRKIGAETKKLNPEQRKKYIDFLKRRSSAAWY